MQFNLTLLALLAAVMSVQACTPGGYFCVKEGAAKCNSDGKGQTIVQKCKNCFDDKKGLVYCP
jgi:hypothetical protein